MTFDSTLSHILTKVGDLKVLWSKWDIRTFIVASFTLQLILILSAPFRKRTSNLASRATLWLSYLLADWVATQAIGLIIKSTEADCQAPVSNTQGSLFAFWAQFLLIHLGGPDTITALAVADTELWLRTGLHLGTQAYAALGVLLRSTQRTGLWAATALLFLAGVIKYLERVMSLSHGRLLDLDESLDYYTEQLVANHSEVGDYRLTNVEMVRDALSLFHCHKRLFADRQLSRKVRAATRVYFARRTPEEAYRVLEIQLNFTYEAIFTKMVVIHKRAWKILRHFVLLLEAAGLVIWFFVEKEAHLDYDIRITHTLVVGAIAVDVLAFLRIQLSDWNIARLDKKWHRPITSGLYNDLLNWKVEASSSSTFGSWFRRVFLGRWSDSIHQIIPLNEVDNLGKNILAVTRHLKLENLVLRYVYLEKKRLSSDMWDFIFEVVRSHKTESEPSKKRYKVGNGEEVDMGSLVERALPSSTLEDSYTDVFDNWLTFTSRHYQRDKVDADNEKPRNEQGKLICLRQDISITLLKYLGYLLTFQPSMMFGAAGKEKLLTELDVIGRRRPDMAYYSSEEDYNDEDQEQGANNIFGVEALLVEIKCEGENVDEDENQIVKWELIARVWVKLLCYAAIRCRPNVHAEQLKQGGEVLSFIWLLMVHLDITKI